ncbi:hypothetical protein NKH36_26235 [Mesorhizobium sp. M1312]|uniref:hypothetical protein n=1 Tax=unclassified Mesorhizobium TaxID=325217 RepID=UPI00333A75E3
MSGVVRKGCASAELLANAVHLSDHSRPAARAAFDKIEALIPAGDDHESFEDTLARVRKAHDLTLFDDL